VKSLTNEARGSDAQTREAATQPKEDARQGRGSEAESWTDRDQRRSLPPSDPTVKNQESNVDEESRLVVAEDDDPSVEAGGTSAVARSETELMAAKIIAALDVIASHMELETPHPKTARRVRGSRTVPPEFVSSLIASVETVPQFQVFGTFDPEEARRVLQSRDALRIVTERVSRLLKSLNYTMESRWAKVASAAVMTFNLASILAETPENGELAAHVETLRCHLARTNKPKAKKNAK
jgi:hypothetical protein